LNVVPHAAKIMTWDDAVEWRRRVRGSVVFTNGVFDLLHSGHIDVLAQARAQGDALVVGLNSDSSVRRLKGPGRPIQSEGERAYVLAALQDVDAVVPFSEDTPLELIQKLRPDVLVKGGDYEPSTVVGRQQVESWGGRVVIIPLRPGRSTTDLIERLRAAD
jgi:D-beta-D-heptose 7-phosphate kinase/D-beta-D-heptose 1-phosphate adenosyltransferase